ncbi:MAG: hypothetical protein IKT79_01990, partial [Akkermansia sp.]|nr:hypothetical protein [Akkermansia sp.]
PCKRLHFERILGFWISFYAIGNKMQETRNKMPAVGRLFIRKSALSAIFCCGFGAGKYYYK